MRPRIAGVLLLANALIAGCAPETESPATTFTAGDAMDMRAAFDTLYANINRLDANAVLASYDTSIAFAHAFDGNLVRGRAAFDAMIRQLFPSIRAIENARIDSVFIIPAGKDAATLVAAFHETVVDTSGVRKTQRGLWSNVFIRRGGSWKIIYGHTSHVLQPEESVIPAKLVPAKLVPAKLVPAKAGSGERGAGSGNPYARLTRIPNVRFR